MSLTHAVLINKLEQVSTSVQCDPQPMEVTKNLIIF